MQRASLVFLLFATACMLEVHAQAGDPESFGKLHSQAPPEIAQMAFLIGEWKLETWFARPDGTRTKGHASLSARYCLDGMGILTEQRHPSRGGEPDFIGTAIYVFNQRLEKVFGSGINTLGNTKKHEVSIKDGRMIVIQSGMLFEGRTGINRTTYYDIAPKSFKVIFDHSADDGKTWQESEFGYTAARVR